MDRKIDKCILPIYFIVFFALTITLALTQPWTDRVTNFNPPDEHSRILVPQYICKYGKLPTGYEEEVRVEPYGFSYAMYTMLPYIIQGYTMRLVSYIDDSFLTLLYAARIVNVVAGLIMCYVIYVIGNRLFSDQRMKWIFAFGVMFWPEHLFLYTYINSEAMAFLSTAIIVYGMIDIKQNDFNIKNSLILSLGVIICALSYYNCYGYILCALIFCISCCIIKDEKGLYVDWKKLIRYGVMISVIVLIGIGWWFIRAYFLFDGDILGLDTTIKMKEQYGYTGLSNTFQARGVGVWEMLVTTHYYDILMQNFIAAFGSANIAGYPFIYRFYKLMMLLGGCGIVLILIDLFRKKKHKSYDIKTVVFYVSMFVCVVIPIILNIKYSYTMDFQPQGRYILPAMTAFIMLIVFGIERLCRIEIGKFKIPELLINLCTVGFLCGAVLSSFAMVYKSVMEFINASVMLIG